MCLACCVNLRGGERTGKIGRANQLTHASELLGGLHQTMNRQTKDSSDESTICNT